MTASSADVLGLFAKWPRPGHVKSRLAATTSPEFAARVALAFLRDSLQRLSEFSARRVLAYDPPDEHANFVALAGTDWLLQPQGDGDLGARLHRFFVTQIEAGARRVVVLGTDSPTLPPENIRLAFEHLARYDVVIGPATDGGYYLIGCRRPAPELFDGIAWGQSDVLRQTAERLQSASLKLALLPPWYDVDTLDDWYMLCGHFAAMRRSGIDPLAAHTEALANEPTT